MLFSPLHTFFKLKANTMCFSNIKNMFFQVSTKECRSEAVYYLDGSLASQRSQCTGLMIQYSIKTPMCCRSLFWKNDLNIHYYTEASLQQNG